MKLALLLSAVKIQSGGCHAAEKATPDAVEDCDLDIADIYYRAQQVGPGGLFVAVKGLAADGHDYIDQAVAQGAVAVICERPAAADALMIPVANSRRALAELAASFYEHPSGKMTVIGITGTNGKTTTSYLIESVLQAAGMAVGVIGTINYRYGGRTFDNPVTTPESLDLQHILADMHAAGTTHVVMEVSSHALDLFRVHACNVDIGVFTNFSQDHLDYHQDMKSYWSCKRKLFTQIVPATAGKTRLRAVINGDDPKGREIAGAFDLPYLTTGLDTARTVWAGQARFDLTGITARIHTPQGPLSVSSPLVGRHNLENILNAIGVGVALELPFSDMEKGIQALEKVPGRLESVANDCQRFVYVDYAHTPDALENALLALRALTADRIICVFGCGGDRDRAKRPRMGAIAGRLSDLTMVTSDNPRTEQPEAIIQEIVSGVQPVCQRRFEVDELEEGFKGRGFTVEADRRKAIALSIRASRPGDTILIAGKGHEPYQVIGSQRFAFDDRQEARAALTG